jgi:hypothetical protein
METGSGGITFVSRTRFFTHRISQLVLISLGDKIRVVPISPKIIVKIDNIANIGK